MLIGIAIEMPFALGEMLLGLEVMLNALNFKTDKIQAYFIRDWRTLQMLSYLPLLGDLIFDIYALQFPIQKVCWGFGGLFQSRFVGWLGLEE